MPCVDGMMVVYYEIPAFDGTHYCNFLRFLALLQVEMSRSKSSHEWRIEELAQFPVRVHGLMIDSRDCTFSCAGNQVVETLNTGQRSAFLWPSLRSMLQVIAHRTLAALQLVTLTAPGRTRASAEPAAACWMRTKTCSSPMLGIVAFAA